MEDAVEIMRKRLLFRCTHTGMKENDILIGAFARAHLSTMTEDDLIWFERLLMTTDDITLHKWVIGKEPVPANLDHPVMQKLTRFRLFP